MAAPWSDIKLLATRPAAAGLTEVDLDVRGTPLEGAHRHPGQYLRLELPGKGDGFFAIASPPGEDPGRLELLVRAGTPLTDALVSLPPGALIRAGPVEGAGFPMDRAAGHDLLLFATGSGIAPLRSLVSVVVKRRGDFKRVALYFGARTPDGFAYASELAAWRGAGIEIVQTVSQPGDSGWDGLTGYVQAHVPDMDLSQAVGFLCGQEAMVAGVTEVLAARGLTGERIFTNV